MGFAQHDTWASIEMPIPKSELIHHKRLKFDLYPLTVACKRVKGFRREWCLVLRDEEGDTLIACSKDLCQCFGTFCKLPVQFFLSSLLCRGWSNIVIFASAFCTYVIGGVSFFIYCHIATPFFLVKRHHPNLFKYGIGQYNIYYKSSEYAHNLIAL